MARGLARWEMPSPRGNLGALWRIDSHITPHYSGVVLIFVSEGGTLGPEVALI
jgi:hypothetical protein